MDFSVENKCCSFCGVQGEQGMKLAGGLGAMICRSCVEDAHELLSSPEKIEAASSVPPWEQMTDTELLATLPLIAKTATQVDQFLVEWVELARARKLSWAAIGQVLGTSRQAAWERFAQRVERLNADAAG